MKKRLLSIFLSVVMIITCMQTGTINVSASTYEYAIFPGSVLKVTQGAYAEFGNYSHNGQGGFYQNAFDLGGNTNWIAPFSGTITKIKTSFNAVVLQSDNKVYWADGSLDYMSVCFVHDNDISDLYVGKHIDQGEIFYQSGGKGPEGPNQYEPHLHICVNRGQTNAGLNIHSGDTRPNEAFFLSANTIVQQTGGYNWKYVSHTTHSYTEYVYYEAAHPHYKCYKCFCGEVQRNTSEPVYLESCSECTTNHTEHYYNEYLYYESTHPHYKCYRCGCGEITKNTSQPVFLDSCSECMNFATISTGTYYIRNNATGTYMDLTNMVDADNTNIGLWTFNGSKAQQYTISYTGNETDFAIQPHCSSTRVVQGYGDTISSGSNVCLWTNNYQSRQRWKFKKTSNGYIIHNTQNLNCVMEGQADNVYLNTYNASASQTWTILNSITYNANGGTGAPDMQMKEYGIGAAISTITPTKDGYKFLGWSTSATAETPSYYAGGSYTTKANITLYAVWAKAVNNRGNVTGDDEIDSKDLTAIRRKLADWEVANFVEEAADTNGDGEFDSKDATYLARYLADWNGYTLE